MEQGGKTTKVEGGILRSPKLLERGGRGGGKGGSKPRTLKTVENLLRTLMSAESEALRDIENIRAVVQTAPDEWKWAIPFFEQAKKENDEKAAMEAALAEFGEKLRISMINQATMQALKKELGEHFEEKMFAYHDLLNRSTKPLIKTIDKIKAGIKTFEVRSADGMFATKAAPSKRAKTEPV